MGVASVCHKDVTMSFYGGVVYSVLGGGPVSCFYMANACHKCMTNSCLWGRGLFPFMALSTQF